MNELLLDHLKTAVRALLETDGLLLAAATEDERQFDLFQEHVAMEALPGVAAALATCLDVVSLHFSYTVQQWEGRVDLCAPDCLEVHSGHMDAGLDAGPLDAALIPLYQEVQAQWGVPHARLNLSAWVQQLAALQGGGATLEIRWTISMDKVHLLEQLNLPEGCQMLFFVRAEKLVERIAGRMFADLEPLWQKPGIVLLVGDARGWADSPAVRLLGRDVWQPERVAFVPDETLIRRLSAALDFRREESSWDAAPSGLTPEQFYLHESCFSAPTVVGVCNLLCAQACVASLAQRVACAAPPDGWSCEFQGVQRFKVRLPLEWKANVPLGLDSLFSLYSWAYENSSSDKLNMVRQLIASQLGMDADQNFQRLMERAADILRAAKSNFQVYLRKGVEDYFARRLKLVEFITSFGQDTAKIISQLTADLVGDLYKTVGVILGVVLATLVNPQASRPVIFWSALLYLIYIVWIALYALPAVYLRFSGSVHDYLRHKEEMRNLLSDEEIRQAESKTYVRSLWEFRVYFTLTQLGYATLGALAYVILRVNA